MDPSQYLHLGDMKSDIRPSKIVVFLQHDSLKHRSVMICVDFQDGRWASVAEEPYVRMKDALKSCQKSNYSEENGLQSPHLVLLTSIPRWWRSALLFFEKQLICQV